MDRLCKAPFCSPEQVLEYLGRSTHCVAISNNRIISIDNGRVTFTYRDQQKDDEIKEMTFSYQRAFLKSDTSAFYLTQIKKNRYCLLEN